MGTSFSFDEATQLLDSYSSLKQFAYERTKYLAVTAGYLGSRGDEPDTYWAGAGTTYGCDTSLFRDHTHHLVEIEDGVFTVRFCEYRGAEEDSVIVVLQQQTITLPEEEWQAFVAAEKDRIDAFIVSREAKRKEESRKRDLEELQRLQKRLGIEVNT